MGFGYESCKADRRQSRTLSQAVSEYKRRYGRPPPEGYERWWKFARKNNITIVDDVSVYISSIKVRADAQCDQIHKDLEPYFALSPKLFRERRDQLSSELHS